MGVFSLFLEEFLRYQNISSLFLCHFEKCECSQGDAKKFVEILKSLSS